MNTYKIKGISDDQTECDCCGRKGLKRTVALEVYENGDNTQEIIRVGVDCASILMSRTGKPKSGATIKKEAEAIKAKEEADRICVQKCLDWKFQNRISLDAEQANKAYYSQFRNLDYRAQDHGRLLNDGKSFARIPSEEMLSQFSPESAEVRFVQHLKNNNFA